MDTTENKTPSDLVRAVEGAVLPLLWTEHGTCRFCGCGRATDPPLPHRADCAAMGALDAVRQAGKERAHLRQIVFEVLDALLAHRGQSEEPTAEASAADPADLPEAQGRCLAALVLTQALRGGALAVPLSLLQPTLELVARGMVALGPPLAFSPAAHALWPRYLPPQCLPPLVEALCDASELVHG